MIRSFFFHFGGRFWELVLVCLILACLYFVFLDPENGELIYRNEITVDTEFESRIECENENGKMVSCSN